MYDARDLTNLLLAFPELRPEDFRPWINPDGGELFGPRRVFPHCSDHEESSHTVRTTKGLPTFRAEPGTLERGQCNQSNSGGVSGVV